ncbi:MAG TPA: hypothetical protein VHG28_07580 [Longimicrobiaceae bacterium]|nr:hypothetical protein [Longimicrobiaceae bacterium]
MLAHAALVGDRPLYERSWSAAWALLDGRRCSPAAADALVHLGRAAVRTTDGLRVQQVVRAFNELPPDQRTPRRRQRDGGDRRSRAAALRVALRPGLAARVREIKAGAPDSRHARFVGLKLSGQTNGRRLVGS